MSDSTSGTQAPGAAYAGHFSERGFRSRARGYLRRAGREVGEKVLFLYYTLDEPELPAWARSVIYGALGYFLAPWDAAPDFIPGVGYADDLGVLTAALATVAVHVTPEARRRAREQLDRWLG
ncbi:hypothetical protein AN478_13175 [Thiohalorhabdus denitrificans]|uniref:Uncharacterized membrane protein YkvA, DUF1232 family n=1 Tax=Thiohalorhabdus denitrificans TaxID=381306 RepID=A0A0P9GGR0_9GAMM|nr:YkvA family protein [Thiohalorhabdus denitrificans]KPV39217.1 hypothetical protein AN478_13175 [Thiohalorhabdus denitrificans]SCX75191.1 Uncharacterized membrane protein YkvA, DUF1232 family [Thiohalorhabdus denitrificans]